MRGEIKVILPLICYFLMQPVNLHTIPIDRLSLPLLFEQHIEAAVLRLDNIHPIISGNKWFKLRYYLEEAKKQNKKNIVTFGGAWSNHIVATAAACNMNNFNCTGIIRGEEPSTLSKTLLQAAGYGMKLVFTDRQQYKEKKIPAVISNEENFIIPAGGYGILGTAGAATILDHCQKEQYTHICCAVGTGTMMSGLIQGSVPGNLIIGISVLKNTFDTEKNIQSLLLKEQNNFQIIHDYHFGGYARKKYELTAFMNTFYRQTGIPSDFVYTGKLFFGIIDMLQKKAFFPGSRLLIIHSGGLQGNRSLENGTLIF